MRQWDFAAASVFTDAKAVKPMKTKAEEPTSGERLQAETINS